MGRTVQSLGRQTGMNEDLELDVAAELVWDPKVDGQAVAVSVTERVVTLRGTVGTFREKREAQKAAERVTGVCPGLRHEGSAAGRQGRGRQHRRPDLRRYGNAHRHRPSATDTPGVRRERDHPMFSSVSLDVPGDSLAPVRP